MKNLQNHVSLICCDSLIKHQNVLHEYEKHTTNAMCDKYSQKSYARARSHQFDNMKNEKFEDFACDVVKRACKKGTSNSG